MHTPFPLILLTHINHSFPCCRSCLSSVARLKRLQWIILWTPGWFELNFCKAPHGGVVRTLSSTLRILERQKVRSERKKHRFELFILTSVWTDRTVPVSLHTTLNWASAGIRESMNGSESTTSPSKLLEPLKWFRFVFPTGLTTDNEYLRISLDPGCSDSRRQRGRTNR